jgi:hypothetical protein
MMTADVERSAPGLRVERMPAYAPTKPEATSVCSSASWVSQSDVMTDPVSEISEGV